MEIVTLPIELQILLVAGYLAYRVFVTGRGVVHEPVDTGLQIITFGSIGRLLAAVILLATDASGVALSRESALVLTAVMTSFFAVACAAGWRTAGLPLTSQLMRSLGIYRDDHQYSAWASIMSVPARWNYVQLQLNDGRTIESNFDQLDKNPPGDR